MLRIISERSLAIDAKVFVCFIDWQKAFDRVNWTKLMQILKRTGIDWRDRRFISNLYIGQCSVSQTVVRGPQVALVFCPCDPLRLNISPKKAEKIKLT
jgi:hypothetical protein